MSSFSHALRISSANYVQIDSEAQDKVDNCTVLAILNPIAPAALEHS